MRDKDSTEPSASRFGSALRQIPDHETVYRFRIELFLNDDLAEFPYGARTISRLIEVPRSYTFWDLHVAIQDAMGWFDYHLHEFLLPQAEDTTLRIGIPSDEMDELAPADGRSLPLSAFADALRAEYGVRYHYDFGDGWRHTVYLETELRSDGGQYPRCIAGQYACPPEDCGGERGYFRTINALKDETSPDHAEVKAWLEAHPYVSTPYDPDVFDRQAVWFHDPQLRAQAAYES